MYKGGEERGVVWIKEKQEGCEVYKGGEGGFFRCVKKVKEGVCLYEGGGVFIKEVKKGVWCG